MSYYKDIEKAMKKLETNGKTLFLAQDQGLEHDATKDLDGAWRDPDYVFNIAEKGEFDGFICQKGLAEKYGASYKTNLVLKVNGKTLLGPKEDPYSPLICSVRKAVSLDAKAIGFTLFPGSSYFNKQLDDFRVVQEEAHDYGLPVTTWLYPRGSTIKSDVDAKLLQDCARKGLELGADFLKMKYNGNPEDMRKQIEFGGKAKMLMAGGSKTNSSKDFLKQVQEVNGVGAQGFAIGRNIWQHESPLSMSSAIRDIQIRGKDIYSALKRLE